MGNFYVIVLDGVGCGAQEDADEYGDVGSNTLGHVSATTKVELPNLQKVGLGNIIPLDSVAPVIDPIASYGKMREVSAGKDSTTGHWEIAGIHLEEAFPTYPKGFPQEVIDAFCKKVGVEGVLTNLPYSGTEVIAEYGDEHLKTGKPIVYTSADSVFQVATNDSVTSVEQLHEWCRIAREEVLIGEHNVGRVIARPFTGESGAFERISDKRQDFSAIPPEKNVMALLEKNGVKRYSVGKIIDLFAGIGFTQYRKTKSNAEGISQFLSMMHGVENSFVFVNLIDFDQLYGHRNDPKGFAGSLKEFDKAVPAILNNLRDDDVLILTADHGNDPVSDSTDHAREFVPLLMVQPNKKVGENLGIRSTFSDIAATALDYFNVDADLPGTSFLRR
jgi:phosphopentomutase